MENAAKPRGRPFGVGNSGRPRGARNRQTVELETIMRKDAKAVVEAMVLMAKTGSTAAGKLILDRLMVPPKDRPVSVNLGPVATLADLDVAHGIVLAEVCAGSITCAEGAALAGMLKAKREAMEHGDLERRITELEGRKKL